MALLDPKITPQNRSLLPFIHIYECFYGLLLSASLSSILAHPFVLLALALALQIMP
jgi:hypothetical protein